MTKIANHLLELIGNTPLVALNKYSNKHCLTSPLIVKVESFNPAGSSKDRIALNMINDAEERGILKSDSVIIEPTSGNTGIGLALVCAVKNYRLILTMPETMSIERRSLIKAYGAEIVLTPGTKGMSGAIAKANELAEQIPNSFIPQQFNNPANPAIHRKTTAEEIWRDTDGTVDVFVASVGTGGSVTGVGERLKELNPAVKIIAVEPKESAVLSGNAPGPHRIQGIGAGFIPDILNQSVIDQILTVDSDSAMETSRSLAKLEGLLIGISCGAAVFAATELAKQPEYQGKRIVVFLPDSGERYLSTDLFNT
jgi:cysteine synthase A